MRNHFDDDSVLMEYLDLNSTVIVKIADCRLDPEDAGIVRV